MDIQTRNGKTLAREASIYLNPPAPVQGTVNTGEGACDQKPTGQAKRQP